MSRHRHGARRDRKRFIPVAIAFGLSFAIVLVAHAIAASPTATTGTATSVGDSSATVTGTVNPNGESTTYSFQFGTTTAYGSQTSPQSVGSGTDAQAVSQTITGLVAGTTYHYRLIATNASGTTVGVDMTFTTSGAAPPPPKSPPPGATTRGADGIGRHGARLHGSVNPNGARTTYYFEFGLTAAYGFRSKPRSVSAGNSARSVSAALSGLQSGKTYHYRLVARNTNGVGLGADRTFTTSRSPRARLLPGMTILVTPLRDRRRPFRFTVRGKVLRPAGVSRARGCRGRVVVRIKSGGKLVGFRRARLTRKCKYRTRVRAAVRRGPRTLRIRARFRGNRALKPRTAPSFKVVAG